MDIIWNAFVQAFKLIFSFDPEFYAIVRLSIIVSGIATILGSMIGIPIGVSLSEFNFRGKSFLITLVHAFMGFPPVVMGLVIFLFIMRTGPLGFLGINLTPAAMIIAQTFLVIPIVAGFSHASMQSIDPRLGLQARSLGANKLQSIVVKTREARTGLIAAIIAGLGRVFAEVGAVMIVGGNIKGQTRVLTTSIITFKSMGDYDYALANGIVLILIAILVNFVLTKIQGADKGRREIEKKVTGYPA